MKTLNLKLGELAILVLEVEDKVNHRADPLFLVLDIEIAYDKLLSKQLLRPRLRTLEMPVEKPSSKP